MTNRKGKIGFTASTFDLLHSGHVIMLKEAKDACDWLIAAVQVDPTHDRPAKNRPIQSIVERVIQVQAVRYVDEVIVYSTEKDLEDLLLMLPIDVRILGEEYMHSEFTGKKICAEKKIDLVFNKREHSFSTSELRKRVAASEQ
jgi:glycerol-3-phosphate cytidylyltransferase